MIDSIHLRLYKRLLTTEQIENFRAMLDKYSNKYKNFGVKEKKDRFLIWGSLPKYMLHNNVESIPFSEVEKALLKLSKETGLPILDAELEQVHIAESFLVNHNVRFYFANMLDTPGYQRNRSSKELGDGVRYKKDVVTISFYDKTEEAYCVPSFKFDNYDSQGVVRIEMRIKKNVRRTLFNTILGIKGMTVRILTLPSTHRRISNWWCANYNAILKKRKMLEHAETKNAKDLDWYLIASYLHKDNRLHQVLHYIDAVAHEGNWTAPYKSKIKRRLLMQFNSAKTTIPTPYIQELDRLVKSGAIYQCASKKNKMKKRAG